MRLDEHPDFQDIIAATAEALRTIGQPKIRDEHVEKDYWVTEVLCRCNDYLGDRALFKGGTSLSKGWGIIRRFSEDVDLAVSTEREGGTMSTNQVKDDLRKLAKHIDEHAGLHRDDVRKRISKGARDEYFSYNSQLNGILPSTVRLEVGTRSGQFPDVSRSIQSDVAKFLAKTETELTDIEIPAAFSMRLMDIRRTFIEKLFAIHSEVERHLSGARELGTSARHYYDLHALAKTEEVKTFLGTDNQKEIVQDYEAICRQHFPSAILPPEMSLRESRALFPDQHLSKSLKQIYQMQIELLVFEDSPPSFEAVLNTFQSVREYI